MGSSDELMAKLRGGSAGNYDVISPSSDVAGTIATSNLAAPLDLRKFPNYELLSPQLRNLRAQAEHVFCVTAEFFQFAGLFCDLCIGGAQGVDFLHQALD